MVSMPEPHRLTPQDYFAWEAQQSLRYEYFDGAVFAMTGGTLPHADIALNLAAILREALRGRCKVRSADAKVGITETGPFVYPDVSVSCDPRDRAAQGFIQHPCLIIEVVSSSTEGYDRGEKFALYRRLDSLQEYVLVGSEAETVEVFRRNASGSWTFIPYGAAAAVELASVEITVPMAAIYEDVVLAQPTGQALLETGDRDSTRYA